MPAMFTTDTIAALRAQLISRIRRYQAERGLRKATLARLAGLSINTLAGMDGEDWSPTTDTLRALERLIDELPARPVFEAAQQRDTA